MAKVDIGYKCGCGFSTKNLEEAANHCDTTSHTITILGAVSPESPNKATKPRLTRTATGKPTSVAPAPKEFENLRSKLRGG